jgi:hypothetical protein
MIKDISLKGNSVVAKLFQLLNSSHGYDEGLTPSTLRAETFKFDSESYVLGLTGYASKYCRKGLSAKIGF